MCSTWTDSTEPLEIEQVIRDHSSISGDQMLRNMKDVDTSLKRQTLTIFGFVAHIQRGL